eukprot:3602663-Rhodomonas_salina.3
MKTAISFAAAVAIELRPPVPTTTCLVFRPCSRRRLFATVQQQHGSRQRGLGYQVPRFWTPDTVQNWNSASIDLELVVEVFLVHKGCPAAKKPRLSSGQAVTSPHTHIFLAI